jgi:hypothetical protein
MNVGILTMLEGAWMARGLLMKCDWLLPNLQNSRNLGNLPVRSDAI